MSETREIVRHVAKKELNQGKNLVRQELMKRAGDAIEKMKPEVMRNAFSNTSSDESDSEE